ncbi:LSM domain-containing protein [Colletotrichum higginsianum]|uniref:Small nuclear ribonucleoprotein Sm D3 n=1 Tax=Colletotrichum higginsianum (strain IMI 349063) TaxID=759273 RepID=H1VPV7_COLHI|nr:LSM domain-containing protein [Colletotrichum higginsianum]
MTSTIGIPIKLLNEAQGHIVTLEITSGQTYRGKLLEAEDNMNVQLKDITVTARDGRVSHLDQVYIRGSHVRFFIVPDMLRNAPMFRSRNVRGRGEKPAPKKRDELQKQRPFPLLATLRDKSSAHVYFASHDGRGAEKR